MLINKCPRCQSRVRASFTIALDIETLDLEINTEAISELEVIGEHHLSLTGEGEHVATLNFPTANSIREMIDSARSGEFRIYCENGHTLALFENAILGVTHEQVRHADYEN